MALCDRLEAQLEERDVKQAALAAVEQARETFEFALGRVGDHARVTHARERPIEFCSLGRQVAGEGEMVDRNGRVLKAADDHLF